MEPQTSSSRDHTPRNEHAGDDSRSSAAERAPVYMTCILNKGQLGVAYYDELLGKVHLHHDLPAIALGAADVERPVHYVSAVQLADQRLANL